MAQNTQPEERKEVEVNPDGADLDGTAEIERQSDPASRPGHHQSDPAGRSGANPAPAPPVREQAKREQTR